MLVGTPIFKAKDISRFDHLRDAVCGAPSVAEQGPTKQYQPSKRLPADHLRHCIPQLALPHILPAPKYNKTNQSLRSIGCGAHHLCRPSWRHYCFSGHHVADLQIMQYNGCIQTKLFKLSVILFNVTFAKWKVFRMSPTSTSFEKFKLKSTIHSIENVKLPLCSYQCTCIWLLPLFQDSLLWKNKGSEVFDCQDITKALPRWCMVSMPLNNCHAKIRNCRSRRPPCASDSVNRPRVLSAFSITLALWLNA